MNWPATDRYELEVSPGGLGFVHDLLNTLSAGKPRETDLLAEVADAQRWLDAALDRWAEATERPAERVELTADDVEHLRDLRDELQAATGHAAEDAGALPSAPVLLQPGPDGWLRPEPRGTGWRRVASIVLIEVLEAQRADRWRRLKTCRNNRCAVAFYDRSRNNSGVWHNVQVCGNAVNLRAYRARMRSQQNG
ncbi:CGNR zinc finger domain-containing protein [Amycolatopsis sp. FDAARGOS 1241]|uniref:CGNR zinc finger domain-containing protein n=1 Tax=Amycolatopsis sp. FDAARGOS 1241 TaxID=2778070 RepID=UPI00194F8623|nr:CGNR zinc finger domain-containing protein [Amycolatopsis sp. FDAARGOS 1241]QRP43328.1 CGNR zinc finger domain-containing protein [Amycolatopsis sp. FDAARGOS 1241]